MSLLGKRTGREKRVYWANQIQSWVSSELSQKEFCRQNNMKLCNFVKWRQRLKKEQEESGPDTPPDLIPVKIKSVPEASSPSHSVIAINLGSGKRIELPLTISTKQLQIIFSCLRFCDD